MMRVIFLSFIVFVNYIFCDSLILQKQNTLYIQNLIQKEEQIAKTFEKYILEEFKIPTLDDLQKNDSKNLYLGQSFSFKNILGSDLSLDANDLKLSYAISNNAQEYIKLLYERELYRDYTRFYLDSTTKTKHIEFSLKSKEAENIYKLLKSDASISIEKTCENSMKNKWCSLDKKRIKYFNSTGEWIELSKKDFYDGDVNISSLGVIENGIDSKLKIGAYIFVKNTSKYIKFYDNKIKQVGEK